jgi:hypothetical protein
MISEKARNDNIDVEFHSFEWSGKNSVMSRSIAAFHLSNLLRVLIEQYQDDQYVIIAHSHGGNVALRAVESLETETASKLRIVTLATPFLQLYRNYLRRQYDLDSAVIYLAVPIYLATHIGVPLAANPDNIIPTLSRANWLWFIFVGLLLSISVYSPYKFYRLFRRTVREAVEEKAQLFILATNYDARRYPPILVLRGVRDEAALALAVGSLLTLISRIVRAIQLRNVRSSLILAAVIIIVPSLAPIVSDYLLFGESAVTPVQTLAVDFVFLAAIILLLMRFIEILGRAFFGVEMAFASELLELDVSAVPDSSNNVEAQTLEPEPSEQKNGMRHGLYSHNSAADRIHEWLQRQFATPE